MMKDLLATTGLAIYLFHPFVVVAAIAMQQLSLSSSSLLLRCTVLLLLLSPCCTVAVVIAVAVVVAIAIRSSLLSLLSLHGLPRHRHCCRRVAVTAPPHPCRCHDVAVLSSHYRYCFNITASDSSLWPSPHHLTVIACGLRWHTVLQRVCCFDGGTGRGGAVAWAGDHAGQRNDGR
ncbi:hypothetical protein EDB83DRAFT_2395730 [Lactarius deliciosus]|nr:hypothetical protein EDB83DRAFT_2395730 [Lactarius deliciosus]